MSFHLAPALLVLAAVLAAGNWILQPARAIAWAGALLVIGGLGLVQVRASASRASAARGLAGDPVRIAVVFAGMMLVVAESVKLAGALGALEDSDVSLRATMALLGAFFVVAGNALPKILRPLAALRDAGKADARQRAAGWAWVVMGLVCAIAWIVLPLRLAESVSLAAFIGGTLVLATQVIGLRRSRP
jgi:hypothetical protein